MAFDGRLFLKCGFSVSSLMAASVASASSAAVVGLITVLTSALLLLTASAWSLSHFISVYLK